MKRKEKLETRIDTREAKGSYVFFSIKNEKKKTSFFYSYRTVIRCKAAVTPEIKFKKEQLQN